MLADFQIRAVLDNAARAAAREPSTASALLACRRVTPMPWHRDVLDAAVQRARAAGLTIPVFTVVWVAGEPDLADGAIRYDYGTRAAVIALSVFTDPHSLLRTCLHELAHLSDFSSGHTYSRADLESRAEHFVRSVMMC